MGNEIRNFKGIWIPKDIWLNKELTIQEKVIIIEIDSLDNENGCFASNKYFADFFGLSTSRVSQIIKKLEDKKWLKIDYETKDKQIIKRIIKINPNVFNFLNRGIKNSKEGCLENAKDNNINNNNINNINIGEKNSADKNALTFTMYGKEITIEEMAFEIYKEYPRKEGKADAIKHIIAYLKGTKKVNNSTYKLSPEQIVNAIMNYTQNLEETGKLDSNGKLKKDQVQYVLQASTFFNGRLLDYLEEE